MGVTFCAVAPEHPLAPHAAQRQSRRSPPSSTKCKHGGADRSRPRDDGKEGHADRPLRRAPADRRAGRGLGRQLRADGLRRRRGDGRAGARRARLRVRQEVRPADHAGDRRRRRADFTTDALAGLVRRQAARRAASTPATTTAWPTRRRSTRSPPTSSAKGLGEKQTHLAPARLGHQPPALLGHADPDHPLRRAAARCRCPRRTCRSCCPRTACPTAAATR